MTPTFRIHPAINFARFGNSEEFLLSPVTAAGEPVEGVPGALGGLPRTLDGAPITSRDLRDSQGHLRRQAAEFRVYHYPREGSEKEVYPRGDGDEVKVGQNYGDLGALERIVWQVHVANKKAAAHCIVPFEGAKSYEGGKTPALRNAVNVGDHNNAVRIQRLVLDPGPRAVASHPLEGVTRAEFVKYVDKDFKVQALPTCADAQTGQIRGLPSYPMKFPAGATTADGSRLNYLGEMRVLDSGRLLVLPGFGRAAVSEDDYAEPFSITNDLNNDGWFDDSADGPVEAYLVFEHGTVAASGAWVVCTDPAYAPQIRNVVSTWDDVFDVWVRELDLIPAMCSGGQFDPAYQPVFERDVKPIFTAASQHRWTANLPPMAVSAHDAVGRIGPGDPPNETIMAGLTFMRNPNLPLESQVGAPLMPLSLGDAGKPFLSVSLTQYFLLKRWADGGAAPVARAPVPLPGEGEALDAVALQNCLGGRYVPGLASSRESVGDPLRLRELS